MIKESEIVYIHFKDNLYGYAAIHPDDMVELRKKMKVIFKINSILSGFLPFTLKVLYVNKILKVRGLRNIIIFTDDNKEYFEKQLSIDRENICGWMLAKK